MELLGIALLVIVAVVFISQRNSLRLSLHADSGISKETKREFRRAALDEMQRRKRQVAEISSATPLNLLEFGLGGRFNTIEDAFLFKTVRLGSQLFDSIGALPILRRILRIHDLHVRIEREGGILQLEISADWSGLDRSREFGGTLAIDLSNAGWPEVAGRQVVGWALFKLAVQKPIRRTMVPLTSSFVAWLYYVDALALWAAELKLNRELSEEAFNEVDTLLSRSLAADEEDGFARLNKNAGSQAVQYPTPYLGRAGLYFRRGMDTPDYLECAGSALRNAIEICSARAASDDASRQESLLRCRALAYARLSELTAMQIHRFGAADLASGSRRHRARNLSYAAHDYAMRAIEASKGIASTDAEIYAFACLRSAFSRHCHDIFVADPNDRDFSESLSQLGLAREDYKEAIRFSRDEVMWIAHTNLGYAAMFGWLMARVIHDTESADEWLGVSLSSMKTVRSGDGVSARLRMYNASNYGVLLGYQGKYGEAESVGREAAREIPRRRINAGEVPESFVYKEGYLEWSHPLIARMLRGGGGDAMLAEIIKRQRVAFGSCRNAGEALKLMRQTSRFIRFLEVDRASIIANELVEVVGRMAESGLDDEMRRREASDEWIRLIGSRIGK